MPRSRPAAPPPAGRIRLGAAARGIQRLEAFFHGQAFAPHRHDTYAVGITLAGVQRFRFRGKTWHCLPGQCHVLHPDELHDGGAGGQEGFGYRILYLDPALIGQALPGSALPFVGEPVLQLRQPRHALRWWDLDAELDEMAGVDLVAGMAQLIASAAGTPLRPAGALARDRLQAVRDCLVDAPQDRPSMATLERLAGLDRWTLARQFRAAFGTSPSRFRTLRQLDHVQALLKTGTAQADAAAQAGFADQSHMARQFKACVGLTPGQWLAAVE